MPMPYFRVNDGHKYYLGKEKNSSIVLSNIAEKKTILSNFECFMVSFSFIDLYEALLCLTFCGLHSSLSIILHISYFERGFSNDCRFLLHFVQDILSAITLLKVLLLCPLSGEKEKVFWLSSPQIITALVVSISINKTL